MVDKKYDTIQYWRDQSHKLCKALIISSIVGPCAGALTVHFAQNQMGKKEQSQQPSMETKNEFKVKIKELKHL